MPRRKAQDSKFVMISVVAEKFDIHPQTLRLYEREGLIRPARSSGNTRLYDDECMKRLEIVLTLTRELGVNLAGVEVVLNMREQMQRMQDEMDRILEFVRHEAAERRQRADHALVKLDAGKLIKAEAGKLVKVDGGKLIKT